MIACTLKNLLRRNVAENLPQVNYKGKKKLDEGEGCRNQCCEFESAWISIILGSRIQVRLSEKSRATYGGSQWSHGGSQ
jgi:hypothetical protein